MPSSSWSKQARHSFQKAWPISLAPFLVAVVSYIAEYVTLGTMHLINNLADLLDLHLRMNGEPMIFKQAREASLRVYGSYTDFMLTMLFVHTIITIANLLQNTFIKNKAQKQDLNSQEKIDRQDVGGSLSKNSRATSFVKPELPLSPIKTLGSHIILTVVQYSVMYLIGMLILSASYSILTSPLILSNERQSLTSDEYQQADKSHIDMQDHLLLGLKSTQPNSRTLDQQDMPDVVNIMGSTSLSLPPPFNIYNNYLFNQAAFQINETQVILFGDQTALRIDISNLTQPKAIEYINITLPDLAFTCGFYVSPDGQYLIRIDFWKKLIYVSSMSAPTQSITFNKKVPFQMNYKTPEKIVVFNPDSRGGYILLDGIYKFDVNSPDLVLVVANVQAHQLLVTSDGKIAIVGYHNFNSGYTIYDLTTSQNLFSTTLTEPWVNDGLSSMALTSDDKTLFLVAKHHFWVIDVTDKAAPANLFDTELTESENRKFILSPDDNTLIIGLGYQDNQAPTYVVDISVRSAPALTRSNTLTRTRSFIYSSNGKNVFLCSGTEFLIGTVVANLDVDYFSFTPWSIQPSTIVTDDKVYYIVSTSDGTTAYVGCKSGLKRYSINTDGSLTQTGFIATVDYVLFITLSQNEKFAVLVTEYNQPNKIHVINLVDFTIMTTIRSIDSSADMGYMISPDAKIVIEFSPYYVGTYNSFYAYDLSNSSTFENPITIASIETIDETMDFTTDWKTFYVVSPSFITAYNMTNVISPTLISNQSIDDLQGTIMSAKLSPDSQSLYIVCNQDFSDSGVLFLFDVSDPLDIKLISSTNIGNSVGDSRYHLENPIIFPSASNYIIVSKSSKLLFIDVSKKTAPILLGFISPPIDTLASDDTLNLVVAYLAGSNGLSFLYSSHQNWINKVVLSNVYALILPDVSVGVGNVYSNSSMVLKKNSINKFSITTDQYKFIRFSLYSVTLDLGAYTNNYPAPPVWMNFDIKNGILSLQPLNKRDIGIYYGYCQIGTPVPAQDLINVAPDNAQLALQLMALGYLDTDYYVTPDFDRNKRLQLYQASPYEGAIRNLLASHVFEIVNRFIVQPSLSLNTDLPKLNIATASQLPLGVSIALHADQDGTQNCRFVSNFASRTTPTFQGDFTVITMESLDFEINEALRTMKIDLVDLSKPCDGNITILDGLNPESAQDIFGLTNYFETNYPPDELVSGSLQGEINSVGIYTSDHFTIPIDNTLFNESSGLKFSLKMSDPDIQNWLTVNDYSFDGNSPGPSWYQFWPYNFKVILDVSNQYKTKTLTLNFHISISPYQYLAILLKIITIIGFYIYFYTFINIIFKKLYQDPHQWVLKPGEEISENNLFPIAFIEKELRESKYVLANLLKRTAKELNLPSVTLDGLVEHFTNEDKGEIQVGRLSTAISDVIYSLSDAELGRVTLFGPKLDCKRDIITQLVLNTLVRSQLNTKKERQTHITFEKIKDKWRELVSVDSQDLWKFLPKMSRISNNIELNTKSDPDTSRVTAIGGDESLRTGLAVQSKEVAVNLADSKDVNLKLLGHALVAHAMSEQHISSDIMSVYILSKEKFKSSSSVMQYVLEFLKLDLGKLNFHQGQKIGYGIRYRNEGKVLCFFGNVKKEIKNRRIVVQIKKASGRLLRELTIYGDEQQSKSLDNTRESNEML